MTVNEYINILTSQNKTSEHELLPEGLGYFESIGTKELTLEQVAKFYELLKWKNEQ